MNSGQVKLGIAPIAWTNDDLPDLGAENTFEQCVSEMALAGFSGCEVGNKYPRDPGTLRRYLEPRGLRICNAWYSTYFVTGRRQETIEGFIQHRDFLHAMGAGVIGCSEQGRGIQGKPLPIFEKKPVFTGAEWELLGEGMNTLAALAAEKDMRVCLHHHMGTGIQTPAEIDRFMEVTQDSVGLLLDTGHLYFSEGDQQAVDSVADKYMSRIIHVHLKDVRPDVLDTVRRERLSFLEAVALGAFTVPGDGAVSFDYLFSALEKNGYSGWMVVEAEQNPAKANPFEYALMARRFIREKTGI